MSVVVPVIPPQCAMQHNCTPGQVHFIVTAYTILIVVLAVILVGVILAVLWEVRPGRMRRKRRW